MGRPYGLNLAIWLFLIGANVSAQVADTPIPKDLKPWVDWVLHDQQHIHCPLVYNKVKNLCVWPSRLKLSLNAQGGKFSQNWVVYADGWVALPGEERYWPQEVKVNGKRAAVVSRSSRPFVRLRAGKFRVSGVFTWSRLPQSLYIPASVGLIDLTIRNRKVETPLIGSGGRLWLRERHQQVEEKNKAEDKLQIRVYRRIDDDIPLRLTTRIQVQVSGSQREEILSTVLPQGFIPTGLQSTIPARLEVDGRMRLQVRPGQWEVTLNARSPDMVDTITLQRHEEGLWPGEEVWVFKSYNKLRSVSLHGLSPLDPDQTSLPREWRSLPSYRMEPGQTLKIEEQRRGDVDNAPENLQLIRSLWLDFNGKGYTVRDQIRGQVERHWRLEMGPELLLGRVTIQGRPRYITQLPKTDFAGVELRQGNLRIEAVSRKEGDIRQLPAVAWDHDFQSVRANLHLPPGWLLVSASGVDEIQTWLRRWTLLDLFLGMLICISIGKLWGRTWAAIAMVCLFFTYLDPDAPRWVWVHLIIISALLRVLPKGRLAKIINHYYRFILLLLVVIALPYLIDQVRMGLYPQLGTPHGQHRFELNRELEDEMEPMALAEQSPAPEKKLKSALDSMAGRSHSQKADKVLLEYDPDTTVQTGPGLPAWTWQTHAMSWNGPVAKNQRISFILLPPWITRPMAFLKVALVMLLMACVMNIRLSKKGMRLPGVASLMLVSLVGFSLYSNPATAANMPNKELLEELRKRLTRVPDCIPECAVSPRMKLSASSRRLTIRQEIHAVESVAVPLPAQMDHWWPDTVLLNGKPAKALSKENKQLWIHLKKGVHQIVMQGDISRRSLINIPLPLRPHYFSPSIPQWEIEGYNNGQVEDSIQLKRKNLIRANKQNEKEVESFNIPAFLKVERNLLLGVNWQVQTRVVRATEQTAPIIMEIPLLEGESVTSEGVRVIDDKVQLVMSANVNELFWESSLSPSRKLFLTAANNRSWVEIWRFKISPIWHAKFEGLPVITHKDKLGNWMPEWRPWPGETLKLSIDRPKGLSGDTLTLDSSHLTVRPGRQATDSVLQLNLRSSQGGQHRIILPQEVQVLSAKINGVEQNLHVKKGIVSVPIIPGSQGVEIKFREPNRGISGIFKSPLIDVNLSSTNAHTEFYIPTDRWILFAAGPTMGPAVLIWGVFVFIGVVAAILGRLSITPLRFGHWLLLGVGLTQISLYISLIVMAWLIAMGCRKNIESPELYNKWLFNLMQLGLVLLTFFALAALIVAVQQGLLGRPDMQISGNGSTGFVLRWYEDHVHSLLPSTWVMSVPLIVYRIAMLAWATWLALALVRWIRWSWGCFSAGGFWHELRPRKILTNKTLEEKA